MLPLIYGYLRVADGLDDNCILRLERRLRRVAEAGGFCYATTYFERPSGYQAAFSELVIELRRWSAHDVVVCSLNHLSRQSILQDHLLARLEHEAGAHVWVVATTPMFPGKGDHSMVQRLPTAR